MRPHIRRTTERGRGLRSSHHSIRLGVAQCGARTAFINERILSITIKQEFRLRGEQTGWAIHETGLACGSLLRTLEPIREINGLPDIGADLSFQRALVNRVGNAVLYGLQRNRLRDGE